MFSAFVSHWTLFLYLKQFCDISSLLKYCKVSTRILDLASENTLLLSVVFCVYFYFISTWASDHLLTWNSFELSSVLISWCGTEISLSAAKTKMDSFSGSTHMHRAAFYIRCYMQIDFSAFVNAISVGQLPIGSDSLTSHLLICSIPTPPPHPLCLITACPLIPLPHLTKPVLRSSMKQVFNIQRKRLQTGEEIQVPLYLCRGGKNRLQLFVWKII